MDSIRIMSSIDNRDSHSAVNILPSSDIHLFNVACAVDAHGAGAGEAEVA